MTGEEREYMFDQAVFLSELLYRQTDLLLDLLEDIDSRDVIAAKIDAIEDEGDFAFHDFSANFREIVIEPSERRMAVYQMVRHIEEGIDMLDELSKCVVRYNVTEVPAGFRSAINCIAGAVKKECNENVRLQAQGRIHQGRTGIRFLQGGILQDARYPR